MNKQLSFLEDSKDSDPSVEWRQIPGVFDYSVSNTGLVRRDTPSRGARTRTFAGKILKPWETKTGYLGVSIGLNGTRTGSYIHELVLLAFIGPRPEGYEGEHKNANHQDNRLENLEWLPRRINRSCPGERNGISKLTNDKVLEIRRRFADGESRGSIIASTGFSKPTINRIIRRASWIHV